MPSAPPIAFNQPALVGRERQYVAEAASGQLCGDGPFTKRCEALLERELGVEKAVLTTSCTDALEMSALLLSLAPGDEVIVPSFTFTSTANAFALRGARIVFADVRPDTLNIDERALEGLVTERTRAIAVVHYAGIGCDMDAIGALAARRGLAIIEDNAHGLFGTYRGRPLGTFGLLATQSFHETKNFTCGEGGALLVNDARLLERAIVLRDKGTNRSRFLRGQVDKYTWTDVGSSFAPAELCAAFLFAQLECKGLIQERRRLAWDTYRRELEAPCREHGVRLPVVPRECGPSYHLFYLLMSSLSERQALIAHLKSRGIASAFHYQPLHLSEMGRRLGGEPGACPVAEDVSDRLVRLPLHNALGEREVARVATAVSDFVSRL